MRVLIVKTSSLGDIIHTLPALTDAARAIPGIRFDWVVEEAFAEIPTWHPAVDRVIPVAIRRWRKAPVRAWLSGEWRRCTRALGAARYDATIDAQGLLKSALLTRYASRPVHGLDRGCVREPLASRFYSHRHAVPPGQHAVERVRGLFAKALGYPLPGGPGDYGLDPARVIADPAAPGASAPYLLFLHGTTWATKHWPELYWRQLVERAVAAGWNVRLPWGNAAELARARRLAADLPAVTILPRLKLAGIAAEVARATACVAVDTGLGHLAAAFGVPTVSLFGPTDPGYTGAWGANQVHLASNFHCAPCLQRRCGYHPDTGERARFDIVAEHPLCFTRLDPPRVWEALAELMMKGAVPAATPTVPGGGDADAGAPAGMQRTLVRAVFDRKAN
jgi:heptosyltransferase-1